MTLATLAGEALDHVYDVPDGRLVITQNAPDWIGAPGLAETGGLFSRAHGDFQPLDRTRMAMTVDVLSAIADGATPTPPELALVDLCAWLASHPLREGYADAALFGDGHDGTHALLQNAHNIEFADVAQSVVACLEARLAYLGEVPESPVTE